MKKNIVLIGMMCCGKTTVGLSLSQIMKDFSYIDLDNTIEEIEDKKIIEIFKEKGENYFRKIESELIEELLNEEENLIISTGGGIVEYPKNMDIIKAKAISFYLEAKIDTLKDRIMNGENRNVRPLANDIESRYEKRKALYEKADYKIDVENKNKKEIALEIEEIYGKICSGSKTR